MNVSSVSIAYSALSNRSSTFASKTPSTSASDPSGAAPSQQQSVSYDFTAMPPADMRTIANDLWKSGKITLDELGKLTLFPAKAERNPDGTYGMLKPLASPDDAPAQQPYNYVNEIQQYIGYLKQNPAYSSPNDVQPWQILLNKLTALQTAPNGVSVSA
jgi:hypothetical protein